MPAPLENFLRLVTSSNGVVTPEMYAHFGGDDILREVQKYDPGANWSDDVITQGGEAGGDGQAAKRLNFDWGKLPKTERGETWSLNPADLHANLKKPGSKAHSDPIYGDVRQSSEFADDDKTLLEIVGPLLVSIAAPMAGGALASAGIGAAGGTAGVTGAAAGLGAGNIANGVASAPGWLTSAVKGAPQVARSYDQGGKNALLSSLLSSVLGSGASMGANALGINPGLVKGILTLGQLARGGR